MEVEPNFDVELCRCQERKAARLGRGGGGSKIDGGCVEDGPVRRRGESRS